MKRILSIVAVIALLVTFMVPAFAAATDITITQAKPQTTYSAIKIFDVTNSGSAYSYTYSSSTYSSAFAHKNDATVEGAVEAMVDAGLITLTPTTANPNVYVVKQVTGKTDADFADFLKARNEANKLPASLATKSATASSASVTISSVADGYYFVTTNQGTVVTVNTKVNGTALSIEDKNAEPTISKTVSDNDLAIGDSTTYTVNVTLKKGITKAKFYDTLPAGVTLDASSIQVKVGGTALGTGNYTKKTTGTHLGTFEIDFTESYLNGLTGDTTVVITYNATLNENAQIGLDSANKNPNTASLQWGNVPKTITASDNVTTAAIDITKNGDNSAKLAGVKFKVYDGAATGGTAMKFIKISDGNYRLAKTGESGAIEDVVTIAGGKLFISHLEKANHTYYFEETETNAGYQLPDSRFAVAMTVAIGGTQTASFDNHQGNPLPSTGGIGTILFVTLGGIAVLVAGVFLLSNKRMSKEDF